MTLTRTALLASLLDGQKDINAECGYPEAISPEAYRQMYDREIGRRVVNLAPRETWEKLPLIYEVNDPKKETPFEATWKALERKHRIRALLQRADEISGIGAYGVILWGIDDGLALDQPVAGSETWGTDKQSAEKVRRNLLYARVLDQSLARIDSFETDIHNPRYGCPTFYTLTLSDMAQNYTAEGAAHACISTKVHWSRITHIVDNRGTSEIYGTPRMQPVWNRLCDLRKVLGGSGEMYWRGGFPGLSLETQPGNEDGELDEERTRRAMSDYMNGLQRYIALTGLSAKSLAPQIADPANTFKIQIEAICIVLEVPYRVFMGIEEGVVSGDQATNAWDGRLQNRQTRYVTPLLIDPVIERLIQYGVLAPPAKNNGWVVEWPDITVPGELSRAELAVRRVEAYAKYIQGGVDALIPPMEFLTIVCGHTEEEATDILKAAVKHLTDLEGENPVPPHMPVDEPAMPGFQMPG